MSCGAVHFEEEYAKDGLEAHRVRIDGVDVVEKSIHVCWSAVEREFEIGGCESGHEKRCFTSLVHHLRSNKIQQLLSADVVEPEDGEWFHIIKIRVQRDRKSVV